MKLAKRTYSLPRETLAIFASTVPPGDRSALVALLLNDWLDKQRRERLRKEVAEGCQEMAALYLNIEKEYHPLEEEVHCALVDQPAPRRRHSRKTRPRGGLGTGR